ncbi:hypothetical protein [Paracidovorax anthurii]|uniref:Uncharacterized protein n=1 Tax=Paracidovorax anthurii TaxID=78229 RepID=A0A328YWM5_9BURK|nr:hypothetical protein [Paracidovorax anthurii]RAR77543.1 hypothetical protein AX018_103623 [Paracidovorax anthurii]WCM92834.1 hypothetical protein M5C99_21230 [Acidovorax sp. NCPPB 2350]
MQHTTQPMAPMEQHNRLLMAQIEGRLRSGFDAALSSGDYYVIRNKGTGVLSVLASTTIQDDHDCVLGPKPFAQCIEFVNSSVVTRMAESDGWTPAASALPPSPATQEHATEGAAP